MSLSCYYWLGHIHDESSTLMATIVIKTDLNLNMYNKKIKHLTLKKLKSKNNEKLKYTYIVFEKNKEMFCYKNDLLNNSILKTIFDIYINDRRTDDIERDFEHKCKL
jgi:hypothetical protein